MAKSSADKQLIVISVLAGLGLTFLIVLLTLLFAQIPGGGPSSAPPATVESSSPDPPATPPVTNGKPPEPPGRDQLTPTTPFGSGLFDSFETDGHGGATGDMVYGRWLEFSRDDSEIAGTDVVSQSEDGQIQPADGQFMLHVDNQGTLYREVSFYGAKNPHLTFAWATTGLDGEDVFKVMVGGQTVLERGSSTPPNIWQQESVDLSRFVVRDETLRISFSCRAEPGTSIYLDDVALTEAP